MLTSKKCSFVTDALLTTKLASKNTIDWNNSKCQQLCFLNQWKQRVLCKNNSGYLCEQTIWMCQILQPCRKNFGKIAGRVYSSKWKLTRTGKSVYFKEMQLCYSCVINYQIDWNNSNSVNSSASGKLFQNNSREYIFTTNCSLCILMEQRHMILHLSKSQKVRKSQKEIHECQ